MGGGGHGVGACAGAEGICGDGAEIWSSTFVRVWACKGMLRTSIDSFLPTSPAVLTGVLWQTTPKLMKRVRNSLDSSYSYLAGNAFGRDKKGRVTKDDSSMSADMQAAGHTGDGGEYSAYVCYEFEIN